MYYTIIMVSINMTKSNKREMSFRGISQSKGNFFSSGRSPTSGRYDKKELINESAVNGNIAHIHILNEEEQLYTVSLIYAVFCTVS